MTKALNTIRGSLSLEQNDALHQPLVSVIIPTFNRSGLLTQAVDSVLRQTYTNVEIIVVDDGSTDDTQVVLAPYLGRISYHLQANSGVAKARNTGITLCHGDYICFLDSDDAWAPNKLDRQVDFLARYPAYGLLATEIAGVDQLGQRVDRSKSEMYTIHNGFVLEHLLFANWIQTSTVMIRRECLQRIGGFDEEVGQFGEDWLLWMRIASEYQIYFLPEPLTYYRVHQTSLSSYMPESQYDSLMSILDKLEQLEYFKKNPHLISKARYRISFNRGRGDLHSGNLRPAIRKLRRACAEKPWQLHAKSLLLIAEFKHHIQSRTIDGANA
ncbi:glycosyltransferase family 2 protein [Acidipila rosea]|uniref:Glycosyltransferase involved in cell wall biosynthesis n=1 Tax=Acidipila rosea TaxID=768535 RepID=A0A4R1LDE0_9BACT|nr:glycosyltransferase family A protein [Acidipila rosea]MBW4027397.1 glycosyltransferase family 2 protein [Acidobacteriota bacterium]TCK75530.1 glycosyltransferase involved in cell wall biosynthesis [Acidipila rosea]